MQAHSTERKLVVFALDRLRYALDLRSVSRAVRVVAITPLPGAPPIVLGIIDLGGDVIPVVDIRRRFGHEPRATRLSDHLVVANTGKRTVALLVDEACGVVDAPPGSCVGASDVVPRIDLVEGAVKLEDGLILIHDLERLLSLEEQTAIDRAMEHGGAGGASGG